MSDPRQNYLTIPGPIVTAKTDPNFPKVGVTASNVPAAMDAFARTGDAVDEVLHVPTEAKGLDYTTVLKLVGYAPGYLFISTIFAEDLGGVNVFDLRAMTQAVAPNAKDVMRALDEAALGGIDAKLQVGRPQNTTQDTVAVIILSIMSNAWHLAMPNDPMPFALADALIVASAHSAMRNGTAEQPQG